MRSMIFLAALATAGCSVVGSKIDAFVPAPTVIGTRYRVVKPDASMYSCPTIGRFPNPDTLTDVEVARTMTALHANNLRCRNSLDAVRRYLDEADRRLR